MGSRDSELPMPSRSASAPITSASKRLEGSKREDTRAAGSRGLSSGWPKANPAIGIRPLTGMPATMRNRDAVQVLRRGETLGSA